MNVLTLIFGAMLSENLFFGRLCGTACGSEPVRVKDAAQIGLLTAVVSSLSALILSLLEKLVFVPLNAEYLYLLVFAAVSMLLTQLAFRVRKKKDADALWLPVLIGCMAVGIAADVSSNLLESFLRTLCTGVGYLAVLVLMASVRDRLSGSKIPACLRGLPIDLVAVGLMTLAFMGIVGLA